MKLEEYGNNGQRRHACTTQIAPLTDGRKVGRSVELAGADGLVVALQQPRHAGHLGLRTRAERAGVREGSAK